MNLARNSVLPDSENTISKEANFNLSQGLIERLYWLTRLRWIAVAGVILTVLFVSRILAFSLPVIFLCSIALTIGIYNLVFFFLLIQIKKIESLNRYLVANRIANLEISLDLACLAVLIHFSGGIENPFMFYFIFHMIIASILLSRQASFLQATFAAFLFCSLVILEYLKILHHYCLKGFIIQDLHGNLMYIGGISFVFISTLYIAVYMATSISVRLRERERGLKEANKLLMEKDHIKSEYVLRVTHDIKEHLAAIQGCIEPVTAGITGSLNEKQMNLLQRADNRTGKLLSFVKALLEITRIRLSKEIKTEIFSFKNMLSDVIVNISARARNKNISVNFTIDPGIDRIRGAREYLQETVANLIANSVKYTPRNGRIDITVSDKGNSIFIQIKDTGIGIPGDELPRIFEEFYRARNAKKVERDGTGLGLSIAKQIIERHNGKIWAESEEGNGSTFNVILPK